MVKSWDVDEAAVHALVAAANRSAGRLKITASVRDLERRPLELVNYSAATAVVLDPPRAGAKA